MCNSAQTTALALTHAASTDGHPPQWAVFVLQHCEESNTRLTLSRVRPPRTPRRIDGSVLQFVLCPGCCSCRWRRCCCRLAVNVDQPAQRHSQARRPGSPASASTVWEASIFDLIFAAVRSMRAASIAAPKPLSICVQGSAAKVR